MTFESSTTASGSANAATLDLDGSEGDVDIHYDFAAAGDLVIEVQQDGDGDWDPFDRISESAAARDVVQLNTMYRNVRAWGDGLTDADVNEIRVITKKV